MTGDADSGKKKKNQNVLNQAVEENVAVSAIHVMDYTKVYFMTKRILILFWQNNDLVSLPGNETQRHFIVFFFFFKGQKVKRTVLTG